MKNVYGRSVRTAKELAKHKVFRTTRLGVIANAELGVRANAELGVIANVRTLQNILQKTFKTNQKKIKNSNEQTNDRTKKEQKKNERTNVRYDSQPRLLL